MSESTHDNTSSNINSNDHSGGHSPEDGLVEMLDLDALTLGSYLDQATEWAASLSPANPGTIIDVGAGSGAGTLALARRFPGTTIVALDKSPSMLAATLKAAADHGLAGRVTATEADLDQAWPTLAPADLLWASSSLHEVADPGHTMREMFSGLVHGGLLVVVEMDALPTFLPPGAMPGLEARLHRALADQGWNHHPDWTQGLVEAGFTVQQRAFPTIGHSTPELTARYARTFLGRIRTALAGIASPADLASLEVLLADGSESLERRGGLEVQCSRTAWAARKP
ncbi:methyltransferase [Arthrobacter sp. LAPM80]|uniref:class I SAM-dependent methyltransferase n=1 Tax=Arthrobacter sp. LAPM80 TaxID=3141788 RepID=UPI00398B5A94